MIKLRSFKIYRNVFNSLVSASVEEWFMRCDQTLIWVPDESKQPFAEGCKRVLPILKSFIFLDICIFFCFFFKIGICIGHFHSIFVRFPTFHCEFFLKLIFFLKSVHPSTPWKCTFAENWPIKRCKYEAGTTILYRLFRDKLSGVHDGML